MLSTIHSAKGLEWDCVYVINAVDGGIPSTMSLDSDEQVEEERRLFYVALTRARDWLEVCLPLRAYGRKFANSDRYSVAQLTRFLPKEVLSKFERISVAAAPDRVSRVAVAGVDIRAKMKAMWN